MKSARCVIFDFDEAYSAYAGKQGIEYISTAEQLSSWFNSAISDVKERNAHKKELLAMGVEEEALAQEMRRFECICLFIGRMSAFIEKAYHKPEGVTDASPFIENMLDKGDNLNIHWIIVHNTDETSQTSGYKAFTLAGKRKTGIHMGGNVAAQSILPFDHMNYTEQGKTLKAGIGLLPSGNEDERTDRVIIPLMKG